MTKSPTAIEFKETARHAFGYLVREFGFREVEPPAKHLEVNPFLVWFANATTLVQVEGINYGFAAQVILGPAVAGDEWASTVPLWSIVKHRRPDLYEDTFRAPGQLRDIQGAAVALREAASEVLRGDFRVFGTARATIDAEAVQQRRTEQDSWRERDHQIAAAGAADAFRAKDFKRVVELLQPHAKLLTSAELKQLAYARARVGDGGAV